MRHASGENEKRWKIAEKCQKDVMRKNDNGDDDKGREICIINSMRSVERS